MTMNSLVFVCLDLKLIKSLLIIYIDMMKLFFEEDIRLKSIRLRCPKQKQNRIKTTTNLRLCSAQRRLKTLIKSGS